MTSQLSRERLEEIKRASGLEPCDWEEIFDSITAGEIMALVDIALAGMDSEPVAVRSRWKDEGNGAGSWWYYTMNSYDALASDPKRDCELLYTAPPAPVAVPDEGREQFEAWVKFHLDDEHSIVTLHRANGGFNYRDPHVDLAWIAWKESRAAMLKAGPVTAATVPDGWKLVPVEPTQEMIEAHVEGVQTGGMQKGYRAMLAAAPAAPEQEV